MRHTTAGLVSMVLAIACTRVSTAGPEYPIPHGVGFHSFDAWNTWMDVHLGAERETIGFYEVPVGTWVTDHYTHLGVTFNSSLGSQAQSDPVGYPNDGYGLRSSAEMRVEFDEPIRAIGVHWPQDSHFRFFREGQLLYVTPLYGGTSQDRFLGLVMDFEFDAIEMYNWQDSMGFPPLHIDDFHFQRIVPVPAPAVLLVVALGALTARGSRRRRAGP
ncbi:MAG: hypothetical protein KF817_04015 [Phycisphaeraceae bacterium]|nr:hypothetical protein [Phycisphaeraceae bacterium]